MRHTISKNDLTFDSLIIGSSNNDAYFATQNYVAYPQNRPPLIISGNRGLGKTHLLWAIHNHLQNNSNLVGKLITADKFSEEMVCAISSRSIDTFHKRYEAYNYLLFDDVQRLFRRSTSQDEFTGLFPDPLCCEGKAIIMTYKTSPMNNHSSLSEQMKNILNHSIH